MMKSEIKDSYYKSRYVPNPSRAIIWKEIVKFLQQFIPRDGTVVDLGAGYCDFINNVAANKKYAVDISSELSNFAAPSVEEINNTAWNLTALPDASVDVIHASNLFEHFDDAELLKVMKEVKRVLKPGGKLILMQPNYRYSYKTYFDDPTHKKVFSHESLKSFIISHDFEIIKMMPKFLPFSLKSRPSFIPLFPFLARAYINSPWKPFAGQMLFVAEKK